jgi:hypothetical protein
MIAKSIPYAQMPYFVKTWTRFLSRCNTKSAALVTNDEPASADAFFAAAHDTSGKTSAANETAARTDAMNANERANEDHDDVGEEGGGGCATIADEEE